MKNQNEADYDIFNEENSNHVNGEFTPRGKIHSVNQTLHFENRFRRDGKGKTFNRLSYYNSAMFYYNKRNNLSPLVVCKNNLDYFEWLMIVGIIR